MKLEDPAARLFAASLARIGALLSTEDHELNHGGFRRTGVRREHELFQHVLRIPTEHAGAPTGPGDGGRLGNLTLPRLRRRLGEGDATVDHLVVPHTLDTHDVRFASPAGFPSGDQFFAHLRDAFDVLYAEGVEGAPKMLSVGLHCRIAGRPAAPPSGQRPMPSSRSRSQ